MTKLNTLAKSLILGAFLTISASALPWGSLGIKDGVEVVNIRTLVAPWGKDKGLIMTHIKTDKAATKKFIITLKARLASGESKSVTMEINRDFVNPATTLLFEFGDTVVNILDCYVTEVAATVQTTWLD